MLCQHRLESHHAPTSSLEAVPSKTWSNWAKSTRRNMEIAPSPVTATPSNQTHTPRGGKHPVLQVPHPEPPAWWKVHTICNFGESNADYVEALLPVLARRPSWHMTDLAGPTIPVPLTSSTGNEERVPVGSRGGVGWGEGDVSVLE